MKNISKDLQAILNLFENEISLVIQNIISFFQSLIKASVIKTGFIENAKEIFHPLEKYRKLSLDLSKNMKKQETEEREFQKIRNVH